MSIPTTTIRTNTVYRLVDLARADSRLGDGAVLDSAPGGEWPLEGMAFGNITGKIDWANMKSGRMQAEDEFYIAGIIWTMQPGEDARAARARCEELFAILYDPIANSPKLGGAVPGLMHLWFAEINGPHASATPEGFDAFITVSILGKSRIA